MAVSGGRKFLLLMWKNWILKKRHVIGMLAEILLPLVFTAVLVLVRQIVSSDSIDKPTYFDPFSVEDGIGTRVGGR